MSALHYGHILRTWSPAAAEQWAFGVLVTTRWEITVSYNALFIKLSYELTGKFLFYKANMS